MPVRSAAHTPRLESESDIDTGPNAASIDAACRRYWHFHVKLIALLLAAGAIVSLGVPLCARWLGQVRFFGWPLPFYMGAQGAIIVYLVLVVIYISAMRRADKRLNLVLGPERRIGAPPPDPW